MTKVNSIINNDDINSGDYSKFADELQADYAQMQAYLQQIAADKDAAEKAAEQQGADEADWNYQKHRGHWVPEKGYTHWVWDGDQDQMDRDKADEVTQQRNIEAANENIAITESKMKALDPSMTTQDLKPLNDMLKQDFSLHYNVGRGIINETQLSQATATLQVGLNCVFDALLNKLMADKYAQHAQESCDSGSFDYSDFAQSCSYQMQEQQDFLTLQDDFIYGTTDANGNKVMGYNDYLKQFLSDDAFVDANTSGIAQLISSNTSQLNAAVQDRASCQSMMTFIQDMLADISPIISSLSPQIAEVIGLVRKILQDTIQAIENPDLSPAQKVAQVLSAMIMVLGLLVTVRAQAQQNKAKMDQEVEKATQEDIQVAQMDSVAQQEKLADAQAVADSISSVMKGSDAFLTVIFASMSGPLVALALVTMYALQASGVMDKLQQTIANKCGDTAAACIVAGLEVAATVGAGGLEQLVQKWVLRGVEIAAKTTVEMTLKAAAKQAAKAAAGAAGNLTAAAVDKGSVAAENVIREAVNEAAKTAAKKTVERAFSQNIFAVLKNIVTSQAGKKALQEAATKAAQEAAEAAIKSAGALARSAATLAMEDCGITATMKAAGKLGAEVGTKTASTAEELADAASTSRWARVRNAVSNITSKPLLFGATTTGALVGSALYGISTTDVLDKMLKDMGKDSDSMQMIIQILNALLQALAMAGAASTGKAVNDVTLSNFLQWANKAAIVATGVEAGAQGANADATFRQADATEASMEDKADIDVFQFVMNRLLEGGKQFTEEATQEIQQEISTINNSRFYSGETQGAQVVLSLIA